MTSKRDLVLAAFRGEEVERVPVGFWYHFTRPDEWLEGFEKPEIIEKNLAGHQRFLSEVQPDFIKLMSDGYFAYPQSRLAEIGKLRDLASELVPLGADHPWISQQVGLVKRIKARFPEDLVALYNIFAPVTYLKWLLGGVSAGDEQLVDLIEEDSQAVKQILAVIAEDIAALTRRVIEEAEIDGIYLSVQTLQDPRISNDRYREVVAPSELAVLAAAEAVGGQVLLHICGYEGAKNHLELFRDYPAQAFNWAVDLEGISLAEGRDFFHGKTVLGGFKNDQTGLLYGGSQEEIIAETQRLIADTGRQGFILGADCTIPSDIAPERIDWVRQAAKL